MPADDIIKNCSAKMKKAYEVFTNDLSSLRVAS